MSDFRKMRWTSKGSDLLLKTQGGTKLVLKEILLGAGTWPAEYQNSGAPDNLVDIRRRVAVTKVEQEGTKVVVSGLVNNEDLEVGFSVLELGVTAEHPDFGDILYMADCVTLDKSSYIHDKTGTPLEVPLKIEVVVSANAEVGFVIDDRFVSATKEDIDDHNTDPEAHRNMLDLYATGTPFLVYPADDADGIGATPVILFDAFQPRVYGGEEDALWMQLIEAGGDFNNPLHDTGWLSNISDGYAMPANILAVSKSYKIRFKRRLKNGLISPWSDVSVFTTKAAFNYPARAVNVSPSPNALNVPEDVTLISSAFAVVGDVVDTHAGSRFRIRQGDTIIYDSGLLGPVTEHTIPKGYLQTRNDYVWECMHIGTTLGAGEWSIATTMHTPEAFFEGDGSLSFQWAEADSASLAGVAQADGAALRSNGVDQEVDEGDWAKIKLRAKIRHAGEALLTGTSKTIWASPRPIEPGTELGTDLGKVTTGNDTLAEGGPTGHFRTVYPGNEPVNHICTDKNGVRWGCGSASTVYKFATDGSITPIAVAASHMRDICATPDGTVWLICDNQSPNRVLKKAVDSDSFVPVALSGVSTPLPMVMTVFNGQLLVLNETDAQPRRIDANGNVSNWGTALPVTGTNYHFASSSVGLVAVCYSSGYKMYFSADGSSWELKNASTPGAAFITDDGTIYWGPKKRGPADSEFTNHNLGVTLLEVTSSAMVGYDASQQLKLSEAAHLIDISSAGFESAPTRVYVLPKLMAATGNAAQAFTADDFSEIAIATATTGTDADADNPKFVLVESIIEVLETSARRVALCVSGLLAGALVKNNETQADVWKQG